MQTAQKIDVHGLSIRGADHKRNHDHFAIATLNKSMRLHQSNLTIDDDSRVHGHNQGHLFLVADGINSCPAPARASGTAVDSIVKYFLNEMPWYHLADGEPEEVTVALEDALHNAQDELLHEGNPDASNLGTTLTLAFVFWPHLYIAHVGNGRCYLERERELQQLTTDHRPAELRRTVGGRAPGIKAEVRHLELQSGDTLVLVTDGATEAATERKLKTALALDVPAEEVCGRVVGGAGSDDRTAIVVRFLPLESTRAQTDAVPAPPALTAATSGPHAGDSPDPQRAPAPSTPGAPQRQPMPRREPPTDPDPIRVPGREPEVSPPNPAPKPDSDSPRARQEHGARLSA